MRVPVSTRRRSLVQVQYGPSITSPCPARASVICGQQLKKTVTGLFRFGDRFSFKNGAISASFYGRVLTCIHKFAKMSFGKGGHNPTGDFTFSEFRKTEKRLSRQVATLNVQELEQNVASNYMSYSKHSD
jgi:hypothetical protein